MSSTRLLLFLTLLNVLNFVDRQLIPSLAPKLIADLHVTRADIGLLYGYVFLIFYTAVGMMLGPAADRWHRPGLVACGLGIWSLMTALSGSARDLTQLSLARMFVGVGEAILTPAALSMLADVYPPNRRAFASGFYYIGVPLGAGSSMIISGYLATAYGWRACFWILGVAGLVLAPLVLLIRNPESRTAAPAAESRPRTGEIVSMLWHALRTTPALWLTILGGTLLNYAISSSIHVLTWMTDRGLPYQEAAYINGAIYTVAGSLGTALGGYAADWFLHRYQGGRLIFLIVKAFAFLPFSLAFYTLPADFWGFYVVWFFSSLGSTAWYGPVFATVQDLTPAPIRATAVAFLLLVINLLGTGPGPWITGWLGDQFGLRVGLLSAVAVGVSAVIPFVLAMRHIRRGAAGSDKMKVLCQSPM